MNPIQVNCPQCQKLFQVKSEDLSPGQVRFQCTACPQIFGFSWPQPPGTTSVRAVIIDDKAKPSVGTGSSPMKSCPRCQLPCPQDFTECPRCGVIFDKITKIRPDVPMVRPGGPDVIAQWELVKKNYMDPKEHEKFVQLCLSKNNLHFASSQYRVVLTANPQEEVAKGMQSRILELATVAYMTGTKSNDGVGKIVSEKLLSVSNLITALAFVMVMVGIILPSARPLIAIGISIIVFIFSMRFFNNRN